MNDFENLHPRGAQGKFAVKQYLEDESVGLGGFTHGPTLQDGLRDGTYNPSYVREMVDNKLEYPWIAQALMRDEIRSNPKAKFTTFPALYHRHSIDDETELDPTRELDLTDEQRTEMNAESKDYFIRMSNNELAMYGAEMDEYGNISGPEKWRHDFPEVDSEDRDNLKETLGMILQDSPVLGKWMRRAEPMPEVPQSLQDRNLYLDDITDGYFDTALQDASYSAMDGYIDVDEEALNIHNLAPHVMEDRMRDIGEFLVENERDIAQALDTPGYSLDQFSSDLYLEGSGGGSGFRDRGLGDIGKRLAEAMPRYEETAHTDENGKVYFE